MRSKSSRTCSVDAAILRLIVCPIFIILPSNFLLRRLQDQRCVRGDGAPPAFHLLKQIGYTILPLESVIVELSLNRHARIHKSYVAASPNLVLVMLAGFYDGCRRSFVGSEHLLFSHDAAVRVCVKIIIRIETIKRCGISFKSCFGERIQKSYHLFLKFGSSAVLMLAPLR